MAYNKIIDTEFSLFGGRYRLRLDSVSDSPVDPVDPVDPDDPLPEPYWIAEVIAIKTNLYVQVGTNASGFPIIDLPPLAHRRVLEKGDTIRVSYKQVQVDGGKTHYVLGGQFEPETTRYYINTKHFLIR